MFEVFIIACLFSGNPEMPCSPDEPTVTIRDDEGPYMTKPECLSRKAMMLPQNQEAANEYAKLLYAQYLFSPQGIPDEPRPTVVMHKCGLVTKGAA